MAASPILPVTLSDVLLTLKVKRNYSVLFGGSGSP